MQLHKLTPAEVHVAIRSIDTSLPGFDKAIPVFTIEEQLHVSAGDLHEQITTLEDLRYISFEGRKKEKLLLTNNGRYTNTPIGF